MNNLFVWPYILFPVFYSQCGGFGASCPVTVILCMFCRERMTGTLFIYIFFNISNPILSNFIGSLITRTFTLCQDKMWSNAKNLNKKLRYLPTCSLFRVFLLSLSVPYFFSRLFFLKLAL